MDLSGDQLQRIVIALLTTVGSGAFLASVTRFFPSAAERLQDAKDQRAEAAARERELEAQLATMTRDRWEAEERYVAAKGEVARRDAQLEVLRARLTIPAGMTAAEIEHVERTEGLATGADAIVNEGRE